MTNLSSAQFLTVAVAIMAAAIALLTLHLATRRFRSERAILTTTLREGANGTMIVEVENVGARPALGIVVSPVRTGHVVKDGLRSGDSFRMVVSHPTDVDAVEIRFRDADDWARRIIRKVDRASGSPVLGQPASPSIVRWFAAKTGLVTLD